MCGIEPVRGHPRRHSSKCTLTAAPDHCTSSVRPCRDPPNVVRVPTTPCTGHSDLRPTFCWLTFYARLLLNESIEATGYTTRASLINVPTTTTFLRLPLTPSVTWYMYTPLALQTLHALARLVWKLAEQPRAQAGDHKSVLPAGVNGQ